MTFFDSIHCTSRAHCVACRSTTRPQFRESIAESYSLPVVNFECPHGVPWNHTPESVAPPRSDRPQRFRLGDALAALFSFCGVRKRPGCGCAARQSWLNRNAKTIYLISGIAAYVAFVGVLSARLA